MFLALGAFIMMMATLAPQVDGGYIQVYERKFDSD